MSHSPRLMPKSQCVNQGDMLNSATLPAHFHRTSETVMPIVNIDADIKARWPQGQCSYSPASPEELAIIGVDLLVRELGAESAQAFMNQVFEKYPTSRRE